MKADQIEIKIDKGVPMPVTSSIAPPAIIGMKVGDSFFIPNPKGESMRPTLCRLFKQLKFGYASRRVNNGVRFWRIS